MFGRRCWTGGSPPYLKEPFKEKTVVVHLCMSDATQCSSLYNNELRVSTINTFDSFVSCCTFALVASKVLPPTSPKRGHLGRLRGRLNQGPVHVTFV